MSKIFIVTYGTDCEEYRILAPFTDKALAEAFAEKAFGQVEEYDLQTEMPTKTTYHRVTVNLQGAELHHKADELWNFERGPDAEAKIYGNGTAEAVSYKSHDDALRMAREETDKHRAKYKLKR